MAITRPGNQNQPRHFFVRASNYPALGFYACCSQQGCDDPKSTVISPLAASQGAIGFRSYKT